MKKIELFVIDTNVLISAFILPDSNSRKALNKASKDGVVVISQSCADEFSEVFMRPKFDKYLPRDLRIEIINEFISLARIVEPIQRIDICRDPKDNKFLELAWSAEAKCIITGDNDLLILNPFRKIAIKSVSDFIQEGK